MSYSRCQPPLLRHYVYADVAASCHDYAFYAAVLMFRFHTMRYHAITLFSRRHAATMPLFVIRVFHAAAEAFAFAASC